LWRQHTFKETAHNLCFSSFATIYAAGSFYYVIFDGLVWWRPEPRSLSPPPRPGRGNALRARDPPFHHRTRNQVNNFVSGGWGGALGLNNDDRKCKTLIGGGIYRLLSYMNKDEESGVNHCCQAFANFSARVTKFIRHTFCINFVIINFVTYKLCYVLLC
jgi:hypothetical protein